MTPEEREEVKQLTGMSDDEIDTLNSQAHSAIMHMNELIGFWTAIIEAQEREEQAAATYLSMQASVYVSELDEDQLRWMVAAATKAIATKMLADAALIDVDPVAVAERVLREEASNG